MTLTKRIIARLDVKGTRLIKGISFEGVRVIGEACDKAKNYALQNIDEIFYADAVASLYGRNSLSEILKKTSKEVFVPITAGGAIRTKEDGRKLLYAGADKLAINTGIVLNPSLINDLANSFGSQCVVASIQARKSLNKNDWDIMVESGRERSNKNLIDWIKEIQDRGAGEIFLTSVDNDGKAKGTDLELIEKVSNFVKVPLVVGGGISKKKDIEEIFKINKKISGISIGWAFHKELFSIQEAKKSIKDSKLEVRRIKKAKLEVLDEKRHIAVIDYGMGNVQSLCNAINKIGAKYTLTSEPHLIKDASYWALPGVGAFPEGMKRLYEMNLVTKLKERANKNEGIIGICLGMQLLFEESEEYTPTKGLNILKGKVIKLPEFNEVLPHVGWNKLHRTNNEKQFLENLDESFYQYFVHSFSVKSDLENNNISIYNFNFGGHKFIAAAKEKNTLGLQFHPERSGLIGLKLLKEIIKRPF